MGVVRRWCARALFLLAIGAPSWLGAQGTGTLVGTVADETTGEALVGARLAILDAGIEAVSDGRGTFELAGLPAGRVRVRVELAGFAAIVEQIDLLPGEIGFFQARLSRLDVAIQGLLVIAARDRADGTERRVEPGANVHSALDLLREQIPGVMVRSRYGAGAGIRIRGSSSLVNNDPSLYIDGILVGEAGGVSVVHALEQIPAERVRRIRVLHGPSADARYGDANNGVILLETR